MKKKSKIAKQKPRKLSNPMDMNFESLINLLIANNIIVGISFKYGSVFDRLLNNNTRYEIANSYLRDSYPQINFSFRINDIENIEGVRTDVKSHSLFGKEWMIILKK